MHPHTPQDSVSRWLAAQSPVTCIQLHALSGCRGPGVIVAAWRRSPHLHGCPFMACVSARTCSTTYQQLASGSYSMHCRPSITIYQCICVRVVLCWYVQRLVSSSRREHRSRLIRSPGSMGWRSRPGGCGYRWSSSELPTSTPMPIQWKGSVGSSIACPSRKRIACIP